MLQETNNMKRLHLTLIGLLCAIATTMAQETQQQTAATRWNFKPMVAVNLSRPVDAPDGVSVAKRLGYEGGFEAEYVVSPRFSASAGLLFAYDRYREDLSTIYAEQPHYDTRLSRQPELKSLYIIKVPLLVQWHPTQALALKTGAEAWLTTNAVMYPGNLVKTDRFQMAIPVVASYRIGAVELGVKYTVGTEKIARKRPNTLAVFAAVKVN